MQEYVLLDSRSMAVEVFTRQAAGGWNYAPFNEATDALELTSVGCSLGLGELYAGIVGDSPLE